MAKMKVKKDGQDIFVEFEGKVFKNVHVVDINRDREKALICSLTPIVIADRYTIIVDDDTEWEMEMEVPPELDSQLVQYLERTGTPEP